MGPTTSGPIVYCVTNIINNKIYIGKTITSLQKRKYQHISRAFKRQSNVAFHSALRKYGIDNFKWEIIDSSDDIWEIGEKETFWIKEKNSLANRNGGWGYNETSGGNINYIFSENSRKKMSLSKKGKIPFTNEHYKQLSIKFSGKGNPFYGKKHSKETKNHISQIQIGKILSEEHKSNISAGFNVPYFIVLRKTNYNYIGLWNNYKQCSIDLQLNPAHVRSCVLKDRKSHQGYLFVKLV
jgi:group I intron endonuclease